MRKKQRILFDKEELMGFSAIPDKFWILLTAASLVIIGSIMIFNVTQWKTEIGGDNLDYFKKHILNVILGFFFLWCGARIEYRKYKYFAPAILLLQFFLLIVMLFPGIGKGTYGSTRWISLPFLYIEPAEFAKLTVVICLSAFLTKRRKENISIFHLPAYFILFLLLALLFKQPHLSAVVMVCLLTFILLFIAGEKVKKLFFLVTFFNIVIFVTMFSNFYRMARVMSFLHPWQNDAGYQLFQAQIGLGSGGTFGVGLGNSIQKMGYLPGISEGFIFALIGEELGFVGALCIMILFIILAFKGLKIAIKTEDLFGKMLASGITAYITYQAFIHIGINVGLIPRSNFLLPFVSYGAEALWCSFFGLGILLNISEDRLEIRRKKGIFMDLVINSSNAFGNYFEKLDGRMGYKIFMFIATVLGFIVTIVTMFQWFSK